jgi:hypothetical protein
VRAAETIVSAIVPTCDVASCFLLQLLLQLLLSSGRLLTPAVSSIIMTSTTRAGREVASVGLREAARLPSTPPRSD